MELFAFQKFNSFRNFWKLSGKILYIFESFGWIESTLYQLTKYICTYFCHKLPTQKLFQGAFKTILYPEEAERLTQISAERKSADKSLISFLILFYFILVNDKDV